MSEPQQSANSETATIDIRTLVAFWRGDRDAILKIASARGMLGVGALLVLSAALAREYDGVDLLAEPWHLVLPLGASLGTSFVLFCLLFGVGKLRGIGAVPFVRTYLRFLGLYWMTAPLAWFYAIPVERFMSPHGATVSNLALLGLVALWRVWLMLRVVHILFGASREAACSLVLLFADAVALTAIVVIPKPVISMMGGIRLTESEEAIFAATMLVGLVCAVSLPVWLIASVATAVPRAIKWQFDAAASTSRLRPGRGLWVLSAASVAVWALVLPITQPQQRLASRVDRQLKAGRIAEALEEMASHSRSDFPARWDPPPHIGYGDKTPPIVDVMQAVLKSESPDWVQASFAEKFGNRVFDPDLIWPGGVDDKELRRYVDILLKLPDGPRIAASQKHWIQNSREMPGQSEARRAEIQRLLDLAKSYDEEPPGARSGRTR